LAAAVVSFIFSGIDWAAWKPTPFLRILAVAGILGSVMLVYGVVLYLQGFRWKHFQFQGQVE
jgi:hypothetical protein